MGLRTAEQGTSKRPMPREVPVVFPEPTLNADTGLVPLFCAGRGGPVRPHVATVLRTDGFVIAFTAHRHVGQLHAVRCGFLVHLGTVIPPLPGVGTCSDSGS